MAGKLDILLRNLNRLSTPGYLEAIAVEVMKSNEKEIIELQQDQMSEGIRGDGKFTQTYKSDYYVSKFKQGSKSKPKRDYKLTGDFYDGMFTAERNDVLLIGSLDDKSRFLEPQEDNKLFGIAEQSRDELKAINLTDLQNRMKDELTRGL